MSGKGSHIVLIGFMASGKSTIGRLLANRLGLSFKDTDYEVVKKEGDQISDIFKDKGESYFRKVESETLQTILEKEEPIVISTGGGAPCFLDGMNHIQKNSRSFYLKVGRATLLDRIEGDKTRPLALNKTKSELKQFIDSSLREREQYYKKANHIILAYDQPEKIVDRILRYLNKNQV